jgi:hypothetical protein
MLSRCARGEEFFYRGVEGGGSRAGHESGPFLLELVLQLPIEILAE